MSTLFYFLMWAAFIFFMMRLGFGDHVMGHRHRHGRGHDGVKSGAPPSAGGARWAPPNKAVDPVCGMTVEPAGSKSAVYDGHAFYFCSQDCREKFEASPKSYTGGAASLPQNMERSNEHRH